MRSAATVLRSCLTLLGSARTFKGQQRFNPMRPSYFATSPLVPLLFRALGPKCASAAEASFRQCIVFPEPRLAVYGLPWFSEDSPVLRRLPARLKESFRPTVWGLAQDPSGGRIRFRTDSTTVGIVAENPGFSNMHHMASVGEDGFDIYVGHAYVGSAWPDKDGKIVQTWGVGRERKLRVGPEFTHTWLVCVWSAACTE